MSDLPAGVIETTPARLSLGDTLTEKQSGGSWKTLTKVTKIERRKCGVHVNGNYCYNTVNSPVFIKTGDAE